MSDFSKLNGYNVKDSQARQDLSDLTITVGQHSNELSDIDQAITGINNSISNLEEEVENINNRKWLFIGDSYAEGYNPDGNVTGWPYLLKNKMNLSNDECIISATGGAGFANTSNKYEDIINNMTPDNNITDILICGGYNDLTYDEASIYNGMSNTLAKINEKFINVKNIYIGFIGGCTNNLHGDIHVRNTYYMNSANTLGITFLHNLQYALFNAGYFGSDKIHPNQYGQTAITRAIYSSLLKEFKYLLFTDIEIDTSQSDYFTTSSNISMRLYSNNDISSLISYNRVYLTPTTDFIYNNGTPIKLGKITQNGIIGTKYIDNNRYLIGNVVIQSYSNPEGYYNMLGKFFVDEDGYAWLILEETINETHDNYQNFGAIHQIQIPHFNIVYITDVL